MADPSTLPRQNSDKANQGSSNLPPAPLEYEETPIIPVDDELLATPSPEAALPGPPPPPKKKATVIGVLGQVVILGILFIIGMGLSLLLKQALSPSPPGAESQLPDTLSPSPPPAVTVGTLTVWQMHQVVSGATKQPIPGLTVKLPPEVPLPICDGPTCASQGTYLPGGTRLTLAARGRGQLLPSVEGAILTDAGGRPFVMNDATVSAGPAKEFSGLFTGTTGGGYSFSRMRGVIIAGGAGIYLELNHFTPQGVNADWDSDEALFDKIIETVSFGLLPTLTPVASPNASFPPGP